MKNTRDKEYTVNPSLRIIGYFMYEEEVRVKTLERNEIVKKDGRILIIKKQKYELVVKDRAKYINVYLDSDFLPILIKLPTSAIKVISYIFNRIEFNKDGLYLHPHLIATEMEMDENLIGRAINELLKEEVIFKSEIHNRHYWINLKFYCYGVREKIFKNATATYKENEITEL